MLTHGEKWQNGSKWNQNKIIKKVKSLKAKIKKSISIESQPECTTHFTH